MLEVSRVSSSREPEEDRESRKQVKMVKNSSLTCSHRFSAVQTGVTTR